MEQTPRLTPSKRLSGAPLCYTVIRKPTKRIRYGPGALLPRDLLYINGEAIMQQHRCDELLFSPRRDYLITVQNGLLDEIGDRLRVVNFMIYATAHFHFYTDSLHLAVRNLDRILSLKQYAPEDLEILGLGCLFNAAKHLENIEHIPWSADMAEHLKNETKVTEDEIRKSETRVLKALKFEMVVPTTITFIRSVIERIDPIDGIQFGKLQCLLEFLAELTLMEYEFLRHNPSLIAASSIYYALLILNPNEKHIWNSNLIKLTGYLLNDMRDCVKDIYDLHSRIDFRKQYDTVDQLYSRLNMMAVAKLNPVPLPLGFEKPAEDRKNRRNTI